MSGLDENQSVNDNRILGYQVNGKPSAAKPVLQFNETTKSFDWVASVVTIIQGSDQTVNNSTVGVNSNLVLPVLPNSHYRIDLWIDIIEGTAVADIANSFIVPALSVVKFTSTNAATNASIAIDGSFKNSLSDGNHSRIHITGMLKTGVNGGTIQHQFAQNTLEVSDLIIGADSSFIMTLID